jgi:hypothetical protein
VFVTQDTSDGITTSDANRLQALYVAGRYGLTRDQSVGVELTVQLPSDTVSGYAPLVTLQHKQHLTTRSAIETGGGVGFEEQRFDSGGDQRSAQALVLVGRARAQAQVTPVLAVEGSTLLRYRRALGDEQPFGGTWLGFSVALGVVAAISRDVDVTAGVDFVAGGDVDQKIYTVGVLARRIP